MNNLRQCVPSLVVLLTNYNQVSKSSVDVSYLAVTPQINNAMLYYEGECASDPSPLGVSLLLSVQACVGLLFSMITD